MENKIKSIVAKLQSPDLSFADVRITFTDFENIAFINGNLRNYSSSKGSPALGIRVLMDGCYGFAGSKDLSDASIERLILRAKNNAIQGSKFLKERVTFPAITPSIAEYQHQPEINPFEMPKEEKLNYLHDLALAIKPHGKIVHSYVMAEFERQEKYYANTEGSYSHTCVYNTLPLMSVVAADSGQTQSRSWPGHMSAGRAGFELFYKQKFMENTERILKEAQDLLSAPVITEEKADIIIGGGHLALQLHESVGHATEADRIFGQEISYAGKTFVKPSMLGIFKYGSDILNIYSDSTDPRGLGYHPIDDEGVPGRRVDIIKDGILRDQQTSRHIAHKLGLEPSSNMKASFADDFPLVRMTNLCIAPGKGSLADLIKNTEHGYYLDFTKTWSIDDNRNNFQFTTEIGYKIQRGEITGIVKEPTYFGITPQFWNACDAICGEEEWAYHSTFHCGKGEPGQIMRLSHGVAPARFKNINVSVKM
ncbi:MAG: TldD/PmbA family protein [Candidatus Cloacimonadales bacterium]|jgi:TldD protein|nr:TldD/PmbA family protein [Candidatus Cloacimonadota bacterium]MDY0381004.1 TldD/PmbA family protein [Candidatus Cloacimonadaceae bacterium]MCB5276661.1 TldD/PmbA family protein [Candidatus Cloacimonadota bacterium]MCK9433626.1 TldD/PmbA family protein [Candidatus Cloacimonadota bacterium]MDD3547292.1 TldD/PmbA family protein [Candidatus Cloacimonadota bacterium]